MPMCMITLKGLCDNLNCPLLICLLSCPSSVYVQLPLFFFSLLALEFSFRATVLIVASHMGTSVFSSTSIPWLLFSLKVLEFCHSSMIFLVLSMVIKHTYGFGEMVMGGPCPFTSAHLWETVDAWWL